MELPRRYRSIFLAGPTFNLLPDDGTALWALKTISKNLDRDATALIPLFIPSPTPAVQLGVPRTTADTDETQLQLMIVSESRDDAARVQVSVLRYERMRPDRILVEERPWLLHWYTQARFTRLAGEAGLRTKVIRNAVGKPATGHEPAFSFWLERQA